MSSAFRMATVDLDRSTPWQIRPLTSVNCDETASTGPAFKHLGYSSADWLWAAVRVRSPRKRVLATRVPVNRWLFTGTSAPDIKRWGGCPARRPYQMGDAGRRRWFRDLSEWSLNHRPLKTIQPNTQLATGVPLLGCATARAARDSCCSAHAALAAVVTLASCRVLSPLRRNRGRSRRRCHSCTEGEGNNC